MTDNASDSAKFEGVEEQTIEAFNKWAEFHEHLIKLGEFPTWLAEGENKVDLVTFFALDLEELETYKNALEQQIAFLEELKAVLANVGEMIDQYQDKQAEAG